MVERSNPETNGLFLTKCGVERVNSLQMANFVYPTALGFVRLRDYEMDQMPCTPGSRFVRFNSYPVRHEIGGLYLLSRIVRPGSYDPSTKVDVPPLVNVSNNVYLGKCRAVSDPICKELLQQRIDMVGTLGYHGSIQEFIDSKKAHYMQSLVSDTSIFPLVATVFELQWRIN